MSVLLWPRDLFYAETVQWQPKGGAVGGGASISGVSQVGSLGGGPIWRLSLGGIWLTTPDQFLAARALEGALDEGATPIIVGPCDCTLAPLPAGVSLAGVPHSDDTPFSDESLYDASPITASFGAGAALRAASVTLAFNGRPLSGGEHFGVDHATKGRRMYRVIKVTGGTDTAPQVTIRPLLREAVTSGQAVDFNRPSCVMRLTSADAFSIDIEHGQWAQTSAEFVEYFGALP